MHACMQVTEDSASAKSSFDVERPATYAILNPYNIIQDNVAAGSERLGWWLAGPPCAALREQSACLHACPNAMHTSACMHVAAT